MNYEYADYTQIDWVRQVFIALYFIIAITSVVGNFMVIWTIARYRHMRTVTNYYILNLAVADFLVALVVMPLKLIEYTAPCRWQVLRPDFLCPLLYYVLPVFVFASVLTLAAISFERFVDRIHVVLVLLYRVPCAVGQRYTVGVVGNTILMSRWRIAQKLSASCNSDPAK